MIKQSWEQFSENIHCEPFCKMMYQYILYRLFKCYDAFTPFFFIAKVQMFKFRLICLFF